MKLLIALFAIALASITVRAQTTNITIQIKVVDGGGTNNLTLNATAQHVLGAVVAYTNWQAQDPTNNTNSFPSFVRNNIASRIQPLADLGAQYQSNNDKLNAIGAQLPSLLQTMSATDQAALISLFRKYAQ